MRQDYLYGSEGDGDFPLRVRYTHYTDIDIVDDQFKGETVKERMEDYARFFKEEYGLDMGITVLEERGANGWPNCRVEAYTHVDMAKFIAVYNGEEFDEAEYEEKYGHISLRNRGFGSDDGYNESEEEAGCGCGVYKTYYAGYIEGYEDGYDSGTECSSEGRYWESEFDSYGHSAKFAVNTTLSESSGDLAFKSEEELLKQEQEFIEKWQYDYATGYEDGYEDGLVDGEYPSDEFLEEDA